jgi:uncharacterized repeat protein (TIGR01451 family)
MLTLDCKNDDLRSIDVTTLHNLQTIDVKNNNDLASIYAKNGIDEDIIMDNSCTLLKYICADDFDTNIGQLPDCVINSYCSRSPGGDYNTLKGKLFFLENAGAQPGIKLQCVFSANSSIQYAVTDALGNYVFYTSLTSGSATITPVLDAPNAGTLFASLDAITQTQSISGTNNTYTINDIVLTVGTQQKHDYEVVVMPITAALPGQQAIYDIVYKNKGCKKVDSDIEFRFPTTLATFVSSSVTPSVIPTSATGYYKVPFVNLLPFESRKFRVTLNILPTAAVGAVLSFEANVILSTNFTVIDPYLADNTFTLKQPVGVAYSNNRITCLQGNALATSEIGNYLHYEIYFTNTGTQTATDVVVKTDFSPTKFNLNSMQLLKSSHAMELEMEDNPNILVNPNELFAMRNSNIGGPGGDGQVLFKIKTKDELTAGSTVGTGAEICFLYSPLDTPVIVTAPIASTTFATLSTSMFTNDASIQVYPNPATTTVTINSDNTINTVELYDVYGRLLQTNIKEVSAATLDISQRASGTYFIKVTSNQGQKVVQIIKE